MQWCFEKGRLDRKIKIVILKMKILNLTFPIVFGFCSLLFAQADSSSVAWFLERTDSIEGYSTTKLTVVETRLGKVLRLNGITF